MPDDKAIPQSKPAAAPDSLTKASENAKVELDERDLDKVTGGLSDLTIRKVIDKSSPSI